MSEFEFVSFEETPLEKHLGIVSVKAYGKILLRYKAIPTKEGNGYFFSPFRSLVEKDGEKIYTPAFIIDSQIDAEEVNALLRAGIKKSLLSNKVINTSVFRGEKIIVEPLTFGDKDND